MKMSPVKVPLSLSYTANVCFFFKRKRLLKKMLLLLPFPPLSTHTMSPDTFQFLPLHRVPSPTTYALVSASITQAIVSQRFALVHYIS